MRLKRSGYTLFQLLVLLAFLLLLLGMMMPATFRVREAANRLQSQNNLKQLGLAVHNYHDTNGLMNTGVDANGFSGLAQLLPYIEQGNLYRMIDFTTSPDNAANKEVRKTWIKVFLSPLDEAAAPDANAGPTSYFLIAGTKYDLKDNDGTFFKESKLRLPASFPDGTSNTMILLESLRGDGAKNASSVQRQHVLLKKEDLKGLVDSAGVKDFEEDKSIVGTRGASWLDGRFLSSTITITRPVNDARPDVDCGGAGGLAGPRTNISIFNVLMCDGSVRAVSKSISFKTLKAATTTAGGEVLGPDF